MGFVQKSCKIKVYPSSNKYINNFRMSIPIKCMTTNEKYYGKRLVRYKRVS